MQNPAQEPEWYGSTSLPHTTKSLRKMKNNLLDGATLLLRHHLETVKVVTGPYEHKRCSDKGLVISVKLQGDQPGNLAKWIDKEKYVYVIRNGSQHPKYAKVSEYQYCDPTTEVSAVPKLEISAETAEAVKSKARTAVVWSLFAFLFRGCIAVAKYAKMVTNPVVATGVILLGAMAALASMESVNYAFHWALRVAGFNGLADTLYVSQLVITNIWFWRFLFVMMLWRLFGLLFFPYFCFREVASEGITSQVHTNRYHSEEAQSFGGSQQGI